MLEQLLNHFHFASMAECRRAVLREAVKIDGRTIVEDDLLRPASNYAKPGSILQIGRHRKYQITQDHLG